MYSISLLPKPAIRVYRECTKSKQRYRILVICTYCPRISLYGTTNTKDEQMTSRCMQRFVTFKILYNWIKAILVICILWSGWQIQSSCLELIHHLRQALFALMLYLCNIYIHIYIYSIYLWLIHMLGGCMCKFLFWYRFYFKEFVYI